MFEKSPTLHFIIIQQVRTPTCQTHIFKIIFINDKTISLHLETKCSIKKYVIILRVVNQPQRYLELDIL